MVVVDVVSCETRALGGWLGYLLIRVTDNADAVHGTDSKISWGSLGGFVSYGLVLASFRHG